MADNQTPTGVKIISVLYYIGAVLGVISGILLFVGGGFLGPLLAAAFPFIGSLATGLFIVLGIIAIGFGVLSFFIGRGLWRGRNWARIIVIVLSFLGVVMSIVSMVMVGIGSSIFSFIINLAIGLYLLLSSNVKKAFT